MRKTLAVVATTAALTLAPATVALADVTAAPATADVLATGTGASDEESNADDGKESDKTGLWGLLGLLGLAGLAKRKVNDDVQPRR